MMLQSYDWKGALASCQEVLSKDPEHLGALEVLAQAQWYGGQFDNVIDTTSRLLRLNPHEPGYRYTRGMAYVSRGDLLHAMDDFRFALGQSKNPEFRAQVASSLEAVEAWSEQLVQRGGPRRPAGFDLGAPVAHRHTFGVRTGRIS